MFFVQEALIASPTFFFTAAEHSGDALGAAVIPALRRMYPDARFVGVGGPKMAQAGCHIMADPTARSAMLVGALFSEASYWWKLLGQIKHEFKVARPTVHIPIDSSTINLRIAKLARSCEIPVCYYVAPQIWASRPWRIKHVRQVVNTLCCVMPFEEKYFRDRGVNAVYVGHPMFDVPADGPASDPTNVNPPLPASSPKVVILPGSRRAEIDANLPPMLKVVSEIKGRFPQAAFVAGAPSEERAWQIRHHLRQCGTPIDIRVGITDAVIRWADLVITKSGTATLQIARHHTPMIAIYAVAAWKWAFARHFITTPYITLVNILAGRELISEYIPFHGSPLPIAREAIELLSKQALRETMSRELAELVAPLAPDAHGGLAADRVAAEVAKLVSADV